MCSRQGRGTRRSVPADRLSADRARDDDAVAVSHRRRGGHTSPTAVHAMTRDCPSSGQAPAGDRSSCQPGQRCQRCRASKSTAAARCATRRGASSCTRTYTSRGSRAQYLAGLPLARGRTPHTRDAPGCHGRQTLPCRTVRQHRGVPLLQCGSSHWGSHAPATYTCALPH